MSKLSVFALSALLVLFALVIAAQEPPPATRDGDHLFEETTGQPKFEIFPESDRDYFLKVVDAQITFVTIKGHELVTQGPYAIVRNPIYLGMLGMIVATGPVFSRWWTFLAAVIFFLIGNRIRIRAEEQSSAQHSALSSTIMLDAFPPSSVASCNRARVQAHMLPSGLASPWSPHCLLQLTEKMYWYQEMRIRIGQVFLRLSVSRPLYLVELESVCGLPWKKVVRPLAKAGYTAQRLCGTPRNARLCNLSSI